MSKLTVFDHPVISHKLGYLRDKKTGGKDFRALVNEISMLMAYEVTRDLKTDEVEIETPLQKTKVKRLSGKKFGIVPILKARL